MQANTEQIGGLFESSWSLKIDNNLKVTALDQNSKNVFIGYQNGGIDIYSIDINGFKLAHQKSQQPAKSKKFFSKNSIDQLREFNNFLLIISEGYLLCIDGDTLENVGTIVEKNCVMVAVNESIPERILALTKKKEVLIFDFEQTIFEFRALDKKIYLSEIPPLLVFVNDKIFYTTYRKDYYSIDVNSNSEPKLFMKDLKSATQAYLKIISLEEMFVVATNNVGIFFTVNLLSIYFQIKIKQNA